MNAPSLLNNFLGYDPLSKIDNLVDEAHTIINGRTVAKTICHYCHKDISELDLQDTCAHIKAHKED